MAELAPPRLTFDGSCPDCGARLADLPLPLPGVEDDFDWVTRDYDSFRLFMMQELASRFPERRRWTAADMEVVVVELLAAALDRASHALDRVQGERFLDSARRPESVRRLLTLIGWHADAGLMADLRLAAGAAPEPDGALLEDYWRRTPQAMEQARREGPRRIAEQRRMVTLADHAATLEAHPLVAIAQARLVWTGAWPTILISVLLEDDLDLDGGLFDPVTAPAGPPLVPNLMRAALWDEVVAYHRSLGLPLPPVNAQLSGRRILRGLVEQYRMIGTEVFLEGARAAAITVTLSVKAKPGYFRSELRQALGQVFAADQGNFFEPGRLGFGVTLYASDIIETAMQVEGVAVACLNLFRRVGKGFEDRTGDGFITCDTDEFILCLNDRRRPERGSLRIVVNGGEAG